MPSTVYLSEICLECGKTVKCDKVQQSNLDSEIDADLIAMWEKYKNRE